MRQQRGFTLLELMVAMAIFAMLAVAGWQVFDGVNRARERAQYHADQLAVLQYAYLQLQQDMGQIIAYPAPAAQDGSNSNSNSNSNNGSNSNNNHSNNNNNSNDPADQIIAEPFMSLNGEQVSFVRFADPDPRYQSSPSIQRIEYIFADERLIRRQYTSIQGGADSISLDTVLLEGVTAGRWQAYLPELSPKFPNADSQNNSNNNPASGQTATGEPEVMLLPKGIGVSFTYQDNPLSWQWALAPQALPPIGNNINRSDANNNNSEDGNNNTGNNAENNSGNSSENPPNGQ